MWGCFCRSLGRCTPRAPGREPSPDSARASGAKAASASNNVARARGWPWDAGAGSKTPQTGHQRITVGLLHLQHLLARCVGLASCQDGWPPSTPRARPSCSRRVWPFTSLMGPCPTAAGSSTGGHWLKSRRHRPAVRPCRAAAGRCRARCAAVQGPYSSGAKRPGLRPLAGPVAGGALRLCKRGLPRAWASCGLRRAGGARVAW